MSVYLEDASFSLPSTIRIFILSNKNSAKLFDKQFSIVKNINESEKCEIFISFNQNEKSSLISFCNTIETPDGGSHENGFKNGILKAIKLYGQKNQVSKISNISINDLIDYSDVIISIFINEPSFEGQTKKRIIMPKLQKQLETIIQSAKTVKGVKIGFCRFRN